MGRRKIQIAPIQDDRNRNVTFGKRRNGLFKKAYELGVLCQVDIAVMVWNHTGKLHIFSSAGGLQPILDRYASHGSSNTDIVTPRTYGDEPITAGSRAGNGGSGQGKGGSGKSGKNSKKRRRSDSDDDDDDDDDEDDEDLEQGRRADNRRSAQPPVQAPTNANFPSISPSISQSLPSQRPPSYPMITNPSLSQAPSMPSSSMHPYAAFTHPLFPGYPYPGAYPNMPNVNPALGNALAGFYHPSPSQQAAAYAAAAAATSQYGPPASYMSDCIQRQQMQHQQMQQQQQSQSYGLAASSSRDTPTGNGAEPGSAESQRASSIGMTGDSSNHRPSLQLSISNQDFQQIQPESNLREEEGRRSRAQDRGSEAEGDNNKNNNYGSNVTNGHDQDSGNSTSQYDYNNSNHRPEDDQQQNANAAVSGNNMQFPEPFINSPSTLFPEMYRNFTHMQHLQAMGMSMNGFDPTSPGGGGGAGLPGGDEEEERAFKWPSMSAPTGSGSPVKEEDDHANSGQGAEGQ